MSLARVGQLNSDGSPLFSDLLLSRAPLPLLLLVPALLLRLFPYAPLGLTVPGSLKGDEGDIYGDRWLGEGVNKVFILQLG